ncbi:MAG: ribosomal protein S18-alanine N-acetyltransferase [Cyanobacteriota bacterium]
MSAPRPLRLGPLDQVACRELDQLALGGLWSEAQWRRELGDQERTVLGLREGGELLALACGQTILDEFHVTAVAVAPGRRRRGLALLLMQALLNEARHQGCLRATLEVDSANPAAVALYSRLGFRTEGRRRGYYRSGGDALIQWITL